ncbi:uncharacterized protein LOC144583202 [Pogona vitticeps]
MCVFIGSALQDHMGPFEGQRQNKLFILDNGYVGNPVCNVDPWNNRFFGIDYTILNGFIVSAFHQWKHLFSTVQADPEHKQLTNVQCATNRCQLGLAAPHMPLRIVSLVSKEIQ